MALHTTTSRVARCVLAAGACAAALAACGSSRPATTHTSTAAPRSTVTRTITRTGSPSTTSTTTSVSSSSSSSTSTTASAPAASTPECVASDLALTSLGGSGATGHLLLGFGLRNISHHACRTGGYPGVLFLDGAGGGLPTTPDHTTDDFFGHTVLRELTLVPGALTSFRLGVVDVGSGDSGAGCEHARGLQVIPPNDTATLRITRDIDECGGTVSVSPLQAGGSALN